MWFRVENIENVGRRNAQLAGVQKPSALLLAATFGDDLNDDEATAALMTLHRRVLHRFSSSFASICMLSHKDANILEDAVSVERCF